jgi:Ion channel
VTAAEPGAVGQRASRLWAHPSAVLLFTQLLGVLLFPFLEGNAGRAVLSLFGVVVLSLAVRAVRQTPALTWVSIGLGIPIVVLTIFEIVDPENETYLLWSAILLATFYFYTVSALLRYLFYDRFVSVDELWATGATFTVVAWAFAYSFQAIQVIYPGSFTAAVAPDADRTWFELLFLSFTNLTSVGLSDITPILPHARAVVMIEQVAGLMYVALVISRIVGLTVTREGRHLARLEGPSRPASAGRAGTPPARGDREGGADDRSSEGRT